MEKEKPSQPSKGKVKCAKGLRGILILDLGGEAYFRVYHEGKSSDDKDNFTDYEFVRLTDFKITIEDDDAYIYEKGEDSYIDFSPSTLGTEDRWEE
jgi:hypothetical protein